MKVCSSGSTWPSMECSLTFTDLKATAAGPESGTLTNRLFSVCPDLSNTYLTSTRNVVLSCPWRQNNVQIIR